MLNNFWFLNATLLRAPFENDDHKMLFTNIFYVLMHKVFSHFGGLRPNMTFIPSSEVIDVYFMSGDATKKTYIFSHHDWSYFIISNVDIMAISEQIKKNSILLR